MSSFTPVDTVYPVERYGAIGDGTTDDGPAIQAEIDAAAAAGGGTVSLMKSGIHAWSGSIVVKSAVSSRTTRADKRRRQKARFRGYSHSMARPASTSVNGPIRTRAHPAVSTTCMSMATTSVASARRVTSTSWSGSPASMCTSTTWLRYTEAPTASSTTGCKTPLSRAVMPLSSSMPRWCSTTARATCRSIAATKATPTVPCTSVTLRRRAMPTSSARPATASTTPSSNATTAASQSMR